jgi:hypothetical protein
MLLHTPTHAVITQAFVCATPLRHYGATLPEAPKAGGIIDDVRNVPALATAKD